MKQLKLVQIMICIALLATTLIPLSFLMEQISLAILFAMYLHTMILSYKEDRSSDVFKLQPIRKYISWILMSLVLFGVLISITAVIIILIS